MNTVSDVFAHFVSYMIFGLACFADTPGGAYIFLHSYTFVCGLTK